MYFVVRPSLDCSQLLESKIECTIVTTLLLESETVIIMHRALSLAIDFAVVVILSLG